MSKKLNIAILVLSLVLNLCFIHASPILAKNAYTSYTNNKPANTQPPGKTIETDVIIAFIVPYVKETFVKKNIKANNLSNDNSSVMSIKSIPNNKFEVRLHIKTFYSPSSESPFKYYHVTVITDGISIDITDIHEVGSQKINLS